MHIIDVQFERSPEQQRPETLRAVMLQLARHNRTVSKKTFFALRSDDSRACHVFRVLVNGRERIPMFSTAELAAEFLRLNDPDGKRRAVIEPTYTRALTYRHVLNPSAEQSPTAPRVCACGCGQPVARCYATGHHRIRHGGSGRKPSSEYRIYVSIQQRCRNPKATGYKYYGGVGIEFRFTSFEQFLREIGLRPTVQHRIDRISDGHFEPGNVRWTIKKKSLCI